MRVSESPVTGSLVAASEKDLFRDSVMMKQSKEHGQVHVSQQSISLINIFKLVGTFSAHTTEL
jgi:hypothetical protein